uniref:Uncharacterized protein n=1 Tax=Leersia perrieri TaxID=77586 RepID=A0A0D9VN17_9ORYZ
MAIAEHWSICKCKYCHDLLVVKYDKTLSMAGEAAAPSPQMGGCQHVGTFVECNRKKYEQHHVIRIEARSFCFKMNHLKHYRDYSGCFISLRDYCSGADLITSVNIMGASVTASLTGTAQFSALAESADWETLIQHYRYLILIHNSRPKPKSGTKKGQAVQMQGIQGAPGQQPVQVQGIQGAPGQQGGIPTTVQALGGSSGAAQGGGQHGQRHKQVGLPRAQGHQGKDKQAPNQRIPKAMVAKSSVSTSSGTPLQSLQAKPQPLPKQQQQQQTPAVRQQKQPAAARKQQKQQPPAVRQQKQPAAARKQQKQQPPAVRQQKQPAAARKQQKQQPPAVRQQKQPAAVRKQQQQQPPPPMPQQLPPPPPAPRWPPLHIGKYNGPNTDPAEEAVRYNRNGREQRTDLHIPQIAIEFMYRVVFPLLLPTLQKALFEAGRFGDLDMPTLIPR